MDEFLLPLLSDHKGFICTQYTVFMICMCESSGCCKPHTPKMTDLSLKDLLHFFVFFLKGFHSYVMFNTCTCNSVIASQVRLLRVLQCIFMLNSFQTQKGVLCFKTKELWEPTIIFSRHEATPYLIHVILNL